MENSFSEEKVRDFVEEVRNFSMERKQITLNEDLDEFLDVISAAKKDMLFVTKELNNLTNKFEGLTWMGSKPSQNFLELLNDLIAHSRNLTSSLYKRFTFIEFKLRPKNILKKEREDFKCAIDDFKEVYEDIESAFFYLPNDNKFTAALKTLDDL